jgi:hypothetical protein
MVDKISTTRITDLPENITMQMNGALQPPPSMQQPVNTRQSLDMGGEQNFQYKQMNVHPNPYGHSQPSMQHDMTGGNYFLPPQQMQSEQPQFQQGPQYKLPSRDIPRNTDGYMQDIETTANYIPAPKLTSDYIRSFQDDDEIAIREHKQKKHKERLIDTLLTELQIPIFIAILFFIYQMPLLDRLIFKKFSFLTIYNEDGNFNFNGLVIKSILFGLSYAVATRLVEIISSI